MERLAILGGQPVRINPLPTALGMIDLDPGDEVITGPITDFGTIIPILYQNAIPVFADVDPDTFGMDPEDLERKITKKTKAVMPVHLFGNPCDKDPILEIARKHSLYVIEDCCQAYVTEYKGRWVGTLGDIGCFSLQQSKHMTCGDGGITITNNDDLAQRGRLFADKGWDRSMWGARAYFFLGLNYRMTELQAAVALAQLKKVKTVVERRQKNAALLSNMLKDIDGITPPKAAAPSNVPSMEGK